MNSKEIPDFKLEIIKKLLGNDVFTELVSFPAGCEYPDDLLYDRIFPYFRIPETEQEAKTYIAMKVDVPSLTKNDIVRDVTVTIRVIACESLMQVSGTSADRIDLIACEIDKTLNRATIGVGIGPFKLVKNTEHILDAKHFYREMRFETDALDRVNPGY